MTLPVSGSELGWIAVSYLLGCFTAGYYWVRWRTGADLRESGSGSVGARNAGRVTGRAGFLVTLAADFAKGALAVGAARMGGLEEEALMVALIAVVVGHNWPLQLRFRGGKGVSVSLGALLVYNPFIVLILGTLFTPAFLWTRRFTLSGMLAYSVTPLTVFRCGLGPVETFAVSATAMLVVYAHRKNIREECSGILAERAEKRVSSRSTDRGSM